MPDPNRHPQIRSLAEDADEGNALANFRLWTETLKVPQHEAE
jgi:hypothetical protein